MRVRGAGRLPVERPDSPGGVFCVPLAPRSPYWCRPGRLVVDRKRHRHVPESKGGHRRPDDRRHAEGNADFARDGRAGRVSRGEGPDRQPRKTIAGRFPWPRQQNSKNQITTTPSTLSAMGHVQPCRPHACHGRSTFRNGRTGTRLPEFGSPNPRNRPRATGDQHGGSMPNNCHRPTSFDNLVGGGTKKFSPAVSELDFGQKFAGSPSARDVEHGIFLHDLVSVFEHEPHAAEVSKGCPTTFEV